MSSMFSASRRKSSSSTIVSANSSISAGGLASTATGIRPTRCGARKLITARSSPDELGDLGSLHLDDDLLAGRQAAPGAPGRSRRRRSALVELGEDFVERAAEVALDAFADVGERLGRDPVAQQLELGDELGREDPLARGEDLAELDVGRPESLEGAVEVDSTARRAKRSGHGDARRGTSRRAPSRSSPTP